MMPAFPALRLPLLFLLCALPLGLVMTRLVPIGEVPDETAHAVRAYALSSGQWIGRRVLPPGSTVPEAGYKVDTGLFSAAFASREPGDVVTAAVEAERGGTAWSGRTMFVSVPNTASYAPVFYLLSAASLRAGRVLDLSPEQSLMLARTANLLGFAALGAAGLLLARRGRYILFALLCLPSSLSLAASVNQDGLLIAACVLAIALLTRPEPPARLWAALAIGAVCLAKPPYLPLVALLAVPAGRWTWRGVLGGGALAALAALPAVLWSLAALRWTVVPFLTGDYAPGPLYTGPTTTFSYTNSAEQLAILRAHPALLPHILVDSVVLWWRIWLVEVVGVLGRLSLSLPPGLVHAWFIALACAAVGDVLARRPAASAAWSLPGALVTCGAALLTAVLVCVVQYMTWTHVGETTVLGVQGRYLVPLLAACTLALPVLPWLGGWGARAFLLPVLGASAAQFMVIPLLVVRRWYLH